MEIKTMKNFWSKPTQIDQTSKRLNDRGWVATHNREGGHNENASHLFSHPAFAGQRISVNPVDGSWAHNTLDGFAGSGASQDIAAHLAGLRVTNIWKLEAR
jgi:hypothetical protein